MDYWPNADAVSWFANEVFGHVRKQLPQAEFWIVGSKPGAEVKKLAAIDGVKVTGRVPDVRPYLAHAGAVVAPLRVARGTQNKVLEAFAMARAVVMTSAAANGLLPAPFIASNTQDEPAAMAGAVVQALGQAPEFGAARQYVMDKYSWEYAFGLLDGALFA
jgi:glycosyltransferase involved in cell wall biosynthesis